MRHDLIDRYRLLTFPVVLGRGQRLFPDGAVPSALRLVETRATGSGIAIHYYERTGRPTFGTISLEQEADAEA